MASRSVAKDVEGNQAKKNASSNRQLKGDRSRRIEDQKITPGCLVEHTKTGKLFWVVQITQNKSLRVRESETGKKLSLAPEVVVLAGAEEKVA